MTEARSRQQPAPLSDTQRKMLRFQFLYLIISFGMLILISNTTIRKTIGGAADTILGPTIGFNYAYPLLSIFLSGILIGLITSVPRYFFTDWLKMGRMQTHTRAFSKEIREAYRNNQKDRIAKLRKKQMEISMETQQISMNTMKPLMVLTVFTLLIFIWLDVFIYSLPYELISFPWAIGVNIASSKVASFMPSWILIYLVTSLTIGYFVTMLIKFVDFSYRLRKLETGTI